jgi:triosephosphate isomerase
MKLIVGNWKMNIGSRESIALARAVLLAVRGKKTVPDIVVCPPFPSLGEVRKVVARTRVSLGAQNMFWEDTGAFTGEVSGRMLTELGVTHAIIGHSERRGHLHETDDMVHAKLVAAARNKLTPILCVGETHEQRERGEAEAVVSEQVRAAVRHVKFAREGLIVAYEPVWAIGTGEAATPKDAVLMHELIRRVLGEVMGADAANAVRILYGGSVDGENAYAFLREPAVNGVLVGGASVKISQFSEILNAASDVMEGQGA